MDVCVSESLLPSFRVWTGLNHSTQRARPSIERRFSPIHVFTSFPFCSTPDGFARIPARKSFPTLLLLLLSCHFVTTQRHSHPHNYSSAVTVCSFSDFHLSRYCSLLYSRRNATKKKPRSHAQKPRHNVSIDASTTQHPAQVATSPPSTWPTKTASLLRQPQSLSRSHAQATLDPSRILNILIFKTMALTRSCPAAKTASPC